MALTQAQLTTLQADIIADPAFNTVPNTPDGSYTIAEAYNLLVFPDFFVWTEMDTHDVKEVIEWTEYLALLASPQRTFELMISNGVIDARNTNVRAGLAAIFTNAGSPITRAAILALAARKATRAEKLFADITNGDGSSQSQAADPVFEGQLTYQDVHTARNL